MKCSIRNLLTVVVIFMSLSAWADSDRGANEIALAAYKVGNYQLAVEIWSGLAALGDARAQNNLGVMYDLGKGVDQDKELAMSLFRESAAQGFGMAHANIGDSYYNGDGVSQDYVEAARWYRLGAISGDNESQFYMGEMLAHGFGMSADLARAFAWYSIAAENGYDQAGPALAELSARLNVDERTRAEMLLAECMASGLVEC